MSDHEHDPHHDEDKLHPIQQPQRSRAVFSQEDFDLIRTAIAHYLKEIQDKPDRPSTRTCTIGSAVSDITSAALTATHNQRPMTCRHRPLTYVTEHGSQAVR